MENKTDWSVYLDKNKPRELLIELALEMQTQAGFLNEENTRTWLKMVEEMSTNEIERRFIFPLQVEQNAYSTKKFAQSLVELYRPVTIPGKFEELKNEIMSEIFVYNLQAKWQAALPLMQCLSDGEDFETAKAVLSWSYVDTDKKSKAILDVVQEFAPRGEEFVGDPKNIRTIHLGIWKPLSINLEHQKKGYRVSLPHTSYDFAGVPCSPEVKYNMLGSVPHDVPPEVREAERQFQAGLEARARKNKLSIENNPDEKKLGE